MNPGILAACCFVLLPSLTGRIKNWRKERTGKNGRCDFSEGYLLAGAADFLISLILLLPEHNYSLSPSSTNIKSSRKPQILFFCASHLHPFPPDVCCGHRVCSTVTEQWPSAMNCISSCDVFALPKTALNQARSSRAHKGDNLSLSQTHP